MPPGDHLVIHNHHRANRHLLGGKGLLGFPEGQLHEVLVIHRWGFG